MNSLNSIKSNRIGKSLKAFISKSASSGDSWPEDEREAFEKKRANLQDDHMRALVAKLNIDPLKLLTHVLVYEIKI